MLVSRVVGIDYNDLTLTLTVTFASGEMWQFFDVSDEFGARIFTAVSLDDFVANQLQSAGFQWRVI